MTSPHPSVHCEPHNFIKMRHEDLLCDRNTKHFLNCSDFFLNVFTNQCSLTVATINISPCKDASSSDSANLPPWLDVLLTGRFLWAVPVLHLSLSTFRLVISVLPMVLHSTSMIIVSKSLCSTHEFQPSTPSSAEQNHLGASQVPYASVFL